MAKTTIEWTTYTFSPILGCTQVKEARECDNCYAKLYAQRFHPDKRLWGDRNDRKGVSEKYWNQPLKWNKAAEKNGLPEWVFCSSMSDWAEDRPEWDEIRPRLFTLIKDTPYLNWQLLTKRYSHSLALLHNQKELPSNLILGFTTGTNATTRLARIAIENAIEAGTMPEVKYFLSCEPLLEDISFELSFLIGRKKPAAIIVGGESGHNSRITQTDWLRAVRDLCSVNNIPFLFKQWGEYMPPSQMNPEQLLLSKGKETSRNPLNDPEMYIKLGKFQTGRTLDGELHSGMPDINS